MFARQRRTRTDSNQPRGLALPRVSKLTREDVYVNTAFAAAFGAAFAAAFAAACSCFIFAAAFAATFAALL